MTQQQTPVLDQVAAAAAAPATPPAAPSGQAQKEKTQRGQDHSGHRPHRRGGDRIDRSPLFPGVQKDDSKGTAQTDFVSRGSHSERGGGQRLHPGQGFGHPSAPPQAAPSWSCMCRRASR